MTGSSTQGIKTVLHPVSDVAAAKEVYAALLGMRPQADESYYVGFDAEGQHIGLVPGGGPQGMTSPVAYWHVPDIEAKLAEVTAAGATVRESPHDVGGGRVRQLDVRRYQGDVRAASRGDIARPSEEARRETLVGPHGNRGERHLFLGDVTAGVRIDPLQPLRPERVRELPRLLACTDHGNHERREH